VTTPEAPWRRHAAALEDELRRALEPVPGVLGEAVRYAVLGGGKRIRGLLFLNLVEAHEVSPEPYLPAAAGIECIHTYSLIHDDLPAMDDDDLRRGRPTCHKVFGEAQAILAGDALLTEGLGLLVAPGVIAAAGPERALQAFRLLVDAVGARGMVQGQSLDMLGQDGEVDELVVPRLKTAAFFAGLAGAAAALAGGAPAELCRFGEAFGLAYQIVDDLLDRRGSTAELGKTAGKDEAQHKATYVALVGEEGAQAELARLAGVAEAALAHLPHPEEVLAMFRWSLTRRS
jgi:geranylgeranyl diphosphate synthase type II